MLTWLKPSYHHIPCLHRPFLFLLLPFSLCVPCSSRVGGKIRSSTIFFFLSSFCFYVVRVLGYTWPSLCHCVCVCVMTGDSLDSHETDHKRTRELFHHASIQHSLPGTSKVGKERTNGDGLEWGNESDCAVWESVVISFCTVYRTPSRHTRRHREERERDAHAIYNTFIHAQL